MDIIRRFRIFSSISGGTLAIVVIVMMVLSILGLSLLNVGSAETNFTMRQANRLQSQYSARSGVEEGLLRIKTYVATNNYQDIPSLFADAGTPIDDGAITPGEDSYDVIFSQDPALDQMKILSTAQYRGQQSTMALTIQFQSPFSIPSDWLNPGGIIKVGYREQTTTPVVINTVKLLGHAPKKSSNSEVAEWKAPSLHFIDSPDSLQITAKKLVLNANLVSFRYRVVVDKNLEDCLVLQTFDTDGFTNIDPKLSLDGMNDIPSERGVLVLAQGLYEKNNGSPLHTGYYVFESGADMSKASDWGTKILQITNSDTISFIDERIRLETTLNFEPTQLRWSKD